ncbi:ML2 [Symbiodinium sp. CCMP2592]|nr:ML2 [Symbiodinium sp. CCMP2592]
MANQQLRKLRLLPAVFALGALVAPLAFVAAPAKSSETPLAPIAAGLAVVANPIQAAWAELPPLEDIPLEDIGQTRQGKLDAESDTFMGISFPIWLFVIGGAVLWAVTWVLSIKPAKDAEGTYRTYIGGGALPPEGFTNPADPRVQEELADEDDELYSDELRDAALNHSSAQIQQAAWFKAHDGGAPCFTDPRLVAAVAESLDYLEAGLRLAAVQAEVPPAALLPQSSSCALATALCFPEEGGVAFDPGSSLAPDFFEAAGPVRSVLPDFLAEPARSGRRRLPPEQLAELFRPRASSWAQLSAQAGRFMEQVAWLLLDSPRSSREAADEVEAVPPADAGSTSAPKGPGRRKRQKERARRKVAEAKARSAPKAPHASGRESAAAEDEPACEWKEELVLEMLEVDPDMEAVDEERGQAAQELFSRTSSGSARSAAVVSEEATMDQKEAEVVSSARSSSPGDSRASPQSSVAGPAEGSRRSGGGLVGGEACAYNFCEINTASWGSQQPQLLQMARDAEVASSSRGSLAENDPINLCEINTASWNSNCSRSRSWMGSWNPRPVPRSMQDIMADLAFFGLHEPPAPATEPGPVAPFPSLTAEALAALSRTQEVNSDAVLAPSLAAGTGAGGQQNPVGGSMLHVMHHGPQYGPHRHFHHHDHHNGHHTAHLHANHHFQGPPHGLGHQPVELPPVPEGSRSTFDLNETSAVKLRLLEQRIESETCTRERRKNNLSWRLWHHSKRHPSPGPLRLPAAAADAAGGPMACEDREPECVETDSLWIREARWERKRAAAAHRLADAAHQRLLRQAPPHFQPWQNRHRAASPNRPPGWPFAPRSASPPARSDERPACVQPAPGQTAAEDHVLVAVPRSRLQAVARLLATPQGGSS